MQTSNTRHAVALPFPRKALRVELTWHRIEDDLDAEPWIAETIAELERYLACWAAFDAFMADRG